MKRVILVGVLVASLGLNACVGQGSGDSKARESCDIENPPLFEKGILTVATDQPAYPPWFEGSPEHYSGFEGEMANEIATRMNLPIKWVVEPFNRSYAPGTKNFDFDVNQISITSEREQVVDFSDGYFDNAQGVLALKNAPIAGARNIPDLKDAQLGTQVGTTSLDFINETIQPSKQPKIYDSTNDAKSALESGQIDAIVTDLVTTVYLRDNEIEGSVVVGKYPMNEQLGMLFEKDNPLVGCVNEVLGGMKQDGTLRNLQEKWLQDYLSIPTLKD